MGLDMYLTGEKYLYTDWEVTANNRMEDGFKIKEINVELGYWRKHPNLHGYLVQEFANGVDDCRPIHLSTENLEKVIEAIKNRELPVTDGFFFGHSDDSDAQRAEDISFFEGALRWLSRRNRNEARDVVYRASW